MPPGKGTTENIAFEKHKAGSGVLWSDDNVEDTVLAEPAHTSVEKDRLANAKPSAKVQTWNLHLGPVQGQPHLLKALFHSHPCTCAHALSQ